MFIILVISVFATLVEAGYQGTSLELYQNQLAQQINNLGRNVQSDVTLTTIHHPEHTVSYAISHADYEYLNQQKARVPYPYNQGQAQVYPTQFNDLNTNNLIINDAYNVDNRYNVINSDHGYQAQVNVATHNGNIGTYQENIGLYQTNVPTVNPVIKKHVYFHVPPPDVEEPPVVVQAPPPKKVYKIIFIKVPSQETSLNVARLQEVLQAQQAPFEDKTLIYVLSKKEEPQQQVVVPKPTTFDHEVFFVKYNGDANNVAAQINDELTLVNSQNGSPILQPGLANGQP